ncbi:hypothetical protein ACLOJK_038904 [Asimina triloba]
MRHLKDLSKKILKILRRLKLKKVLREVFQDRKRNDSTHDEEYPFKVIARVGVPSSETQEEFSTPPEHQNPVLHLPHGVASEPNAGEMPTIDRTGPEQWQQLLLLSRRRRVQIGSDLIIVFWRQI